MCAKPRTLQRLKSKIKLFSMKIEKKWKSAGSRKERFLLKYKDWLETEYFKFDFLGDNEEFSSSEDEETIGATPGRPQKAFHDCSEGVKRQKVKDLLDAHEMATSAARRGEFNVNLSCIETRAWQILVS